jgi:hypothetical protein
MAWGARRAPTGGALSNPMNETATSKPRTVAVIGQVLLYAALAVAIWLFSQWPDYHQLQPGEALIKLSIVHEAQHVQACVQRTPEELQRLPPNMRAPMNCPRERAPLVVELDLDGRQVFRQVAPPSGLAHDGRATLYHRLVTTAGTHHVAVRLRDRPGNEGFDYHGEATVQLQPAHILVIDFQPGQREITFR